MDHWIEHHQGCAYDADGAWAARGHVDTALLARLLDEPYFRQPAPKSTGRDLFRPDWLQPRLAAGEPMAPIDVQATLCELTARAIADDVRREAAEATELLVCGGGALNRHLMARLQALLPGLPVRPTDTRGLPVMQVEAAAFAWLASMQVHRRPAGEPAVTGARGPRILGALYPA